MDSVDIAFAPALDLAQRIRKREISPLELTEIYLERIQRFDPQLGSFFTVAADLALADAQAKTEQLAKAFDTTKLPPFFGVPTAIKDLNPTAGLPCSYGVAALKSNIATEDDNVSQRMKDAGFILLGKTATSELGTFPYCESPGFAPTRNPWNLDYTAGGSSGGAAAAVAAGLCAIAQGADGGGSIRGPAACCGVVGLKPSRGRISNAPVGDFQSGIATNGVLARSVADAASLLDIFSGYVTGDPYWLADPAIPFQQAAMNKLSKLKIAFDFTISPFPEAAEPCQQGVKETVKQLEAMGYVIEQASPDCEGLVPPFKRIWQSGITASGIPISLLSPFNQWLGNQAGTAGEYLQAVQAMHLLSRRIVAFFQHYDVLLLPVYLQQPIRAGTWAELPPEITVEKIIDWIAPCPLANASGLPAISLPVGWDEDGLPLAIQLVGKPADEATLLALATQLEAVNSWHRKQPNFMVF